MFLRATILAMAVVLATGGAADARQAEPVTLTLPAPTGPHRTGVTTLHLVDHSRGDPWNGAPSRELMATVFYPARDVAGYPVAPQLSPVVAALFRQIDTVFLHPDLPEDGVDYAATRTHSHQGAPARPGRRAVLLYSPGGADPRTVGTGLAEELASHGYVVVTVDHPGETSAVELPGGRVRTIELPPDATTNPQVSRLMLTTRFADTRFVLDQLQLLAAGGNPDAGARELPRGLGRALDLRRVGMYGHSAGGATAAEAMYLDRRIDAAVNLEGYLDYLPEQPGREGELFRIARHGTTRPLLLMGTDGYRDERFDRSWSAMLAHGPCTRREQLDDATHWVFTDYGAVMPQLQAAGLVSAEARANLVGAIDPARSVPAVRDEVRSFFDRHLTRRGVPRAPCARR